MEILGHAVEYLTDELVHEGGAFSANNAQVKAIQILMAKNREIYLACPLQLTVHEKIVRWVSKHLKYSHNSVDDA